MTAKAINLIPTPEKAATQHGRLHQNAYASVKTERSCQLHWNVCATTKSS